MHHIFSSKEIPSLRSKGSLMYFMFRYFFISKTYSAAYDTLIRFSEMFWEYIDATRQLGNSSVSTSEVGLASELRC